MTGQLTDLGSGGVTTPQKLVILWTSYLEIGVG